MDFYTDVSIDFLKPGTVIASDVYIEDHLLLKSGNTITEYFVEALKRRGIMHIRVTDKAASDLMNATGEADLAEADEEKKSGEVTPEMTGELREAERELWRFSGIEPAIEERRLRDAFGEVAGVFDRVRAGQSPGIAGLQRFIADTIDKFRDEPGSALNLLSTENYDEYTYNHSINVALLFSMVGQDIFPVDELELLTIGALLIDIGMTRIPKEILAKKTPLSNSEIEIIRTHPVLGSKILREYRTLSADAVRICMSHHERYDGSGYPESLMGEEIPFAAQLAAVIDVYDALVSSRTYRSPFDYYQAMVIILRSTGRQFSRRSVSVFCAKVGLHPVGTFVRISTGEIAVVKGFTRDTLYRPLVSVLYDSRFNRLDKPKELDLSLSPDIAITDVISLRTGNGASENEPG